LVAPVDGAEVPAVVKIPMPVEIEVGTVAGDFRDREAAALRVWSGDGAIELLAHDQVSGAMLLERCLPGATLDTIGRPEDADTAAAEVLQLLHRTVDEIDGFERLNDRADALAAELPDRFAHLPARFDSRLVDRAVEISAELAQPTGEDVLLHGDTHHHNHPVGGATTLARNRSAAHDR